MRRFAISLLVTVLMASAFAADYYVREDGNDACNGTVNAAGSSGNCAWRSVAHCETNTACGDTCNVAAGHYSEPEISLADKTCTSGSPWVLRGASKATTILGLNMVEIDHTTCALKSGSSVVYECTVPTNGHVGNDANQSVMNPTDWSLLATATVVDQASPSWPGTGIDLAGNARTGTYDMGAYEVTNTRFGTDYYVRPDGHDTNCNGTADAAASAAPNCAWREVSHCASQVSAGDRCLIAAGDYDADFTVSASGTTAALTGTVSCTRGSTAVTGTGTAFTTQLQAGDYIRCDGNPTIDTIDYRVQGYFPWTEVASVQSDTALTLKEGYRGVTDTDGADDTRLRAIEFVGQGTSPNDVRITHWTPLTTLGITPAQYTGHVGDCDLGTAGTQDCTNVWYFDAPRSASYAGSDTAYAGLMQGDFDASPLYPRTQHVGQNFGVEPFFPFDRLRDNTCTTDAQHMAHVNRWDGSYWVDAGAGAGGEDRWYYNPRTASDPLYTATSRRTTVSGSYVIFRNLSTWAAFQGMDQHSPSGGEFLDGGLVIGTGASHLLFSNYWHHGNRWGGVSRNATNTHIVVENAHLPGLVGVWYDYTGFFDVVFERFQKSTNGDFDGTTAAAGPTFDRTWHRHSMAYLYGTSEGANCASNAPRAYNWSHGTYHGDDSYAGTHGLFMSAEPGGVTAESLWVLNSIIEGTSDGIRMVADGRMHFYNNTFGKDAEGQAEDQMLRPDRPSWGPPAGNDIRIYNNLFIRYSSNAENLNYEIDAAYNSHTTADYNVYLSAMTTTTIIDAGSSDKTLAQARADGLEANGAEYTSQTLTSWVVDPTFVGDGVSNYTPVSGATGLIDQGNSAVCPSYDYYGNPRSAACDVGAVEYTGGGSCGDGTITSPEVCDTNGPQLGGQTCLTQGFDGGTLACASDCLSFDTSGCTTTAKPVGLSGVVLRGVTIR